MEPGTQEDMLCPVPRAKTADKFYFLNKGRVCFIVSRHIVPYRVWRKKAPVNLPKKFSLGRRVVGGYYHIM